MKQSMLLRMYDVVLCLFYSRQIYISRIGLQKLIYLTDSINYIYTYLPVKNGHMTWNFGPYDVNIQNAVDSLVFRGFVSSRDVHIRTDNNISCKYCLTSHGIELANKIISESKIDKLRIRIAQEMVKSLSDRAMLNSEKLKDLVYEDPLFLKTRAYLGQRANLSFNNLQENELFNFILLGLDIYGLAINEDIIPFICDFYIEYLYRSKLNK